ncbi:hypothetical protein [Microbulbifer aggregans]|uniref:hypothetical protein n=1 Tax=Microbulbifer aggregans TaxID=1769779 RepID=UPI001CFE507D|nr:hypothetical protein [Microbulbifer aggregans]
MKRIFIATALGALIALPTGAASLDQPTVNAPEWQPPKFDTALPDTVGKRPKHDADSDLAMEKRLRQLELLEEQAQRARARLEKLQKRLSPAT